MEANGTLSILPKGDYKPVTVQDMNLKAKQQGLCANVIIDGNIMSKNLEKIHKTDKWLLNQIKVKGYELKDVLLATVDINEKVSVYGRNNLDESFDVLE